MFIKREEYEALLKRISDLEAEQMIQKDHGKDIGILYKRISSVENEIEDINIGCLNNCLEDIWTRLDNLEDRIDTDKVIMDGVNELLNYNPYDHVKGV